jgi:hypothetical protein
MDSNQGMQNGVQISPRSGIAEDEIPEVTPVQFSVGGEHAGSKPPYDSLKAGSSGRNHRSGSFIRVDDGYAEFRESFRRGALAARNTAGEPDSQAWRHISA